MNKFSTTQTEKLTREMVDSIKPGETLVCILPDFKAVESAKTTVAQMRRINNTNYSCSISGENSISITRP